MLNPQAPVPLYHQLAEKLAGQIRAGEFAPGSKIPSEHQLAATFGIGRPTVRQAIDALVRKGLLHRRRGSGTFVCEPAQEVDLFSLDGTGASFHKKGLAVETRILAPVVLQAISADKDNPFNQGQAYCFSRLTLAGETPVLLEEFFLHPQLFAGIETLDLKGRSLSAITEEHFFLRPSGGKQSFHIDYPQGEKAQLLQLSTETPLLRVERLLHFPQTERGFYSRLYCRTDQFVFSQNIGELRL